MSLAVLKGLVQTLITVFQFFLDNKLGGGNLSLLALPRFNLRIQRCLCGGNITWVWVGGQKLFLFCTHADLVHTHPPPKPPHTLYPHP